MLKKILQQLMGQKFSSRNRRYSSSDHKYRRNSHRSSGHGHQYYKKKRGSSFSSYSS